MEVAERMKTYRIGKADASTRAQVINLKKTPSCMGGSCEEPWKFESLNIMHQNRKKNRGQCFRVKLVKIKAAKIILAANSLKCVLIYM